MEICRVFENDENEEIHLIEDSRLGKVVFRYYNVINIERYDYPGRIGLALDYCRLHKPKIIYSFFNPETLEKICEYIQEASYLEGICFSSLHAVDNYDQIEMLMKALVKNKNVTNLEIYTSIYDNALYGIGKYIDRTGLKSLCLTDIFSFPDSKTRAIMYENGSQRGFAKLSQAKYLTSLTVRSIGDHECISIMKGLPSLKELVIPESTISDVGLEYLSTKKLEVIKIDSHFITDKGLLKYGKTLKGNIIVRKITIKGSAMSNDAGHRFALEYASQCVMLEYIWLSFWGLTLGFHRECINRCRKITWNRYYLKHLGKNNPIVMGFILSCKRLKPTLPVEMIEHVLSFITVKT